MTEKTKTVKRGRPQLTREEVQEKLLTLGWKIPETVKFRGTNERHTLVCIHCGFVTEKWIHNVVYKGETCPNRGNHGTNHGTVAPQAEIITAGVVVPEVDYDKIADIVAESIASSLEPIQELILSTAINREDLIGKFTKIFGGTVSRKGYITYGRMMDTDEWFTTSDIIAYALIQRLDPQEKTSLKKNYQYHRGKNPNTTPDKVLLMIMSKTVLFKALEQIQLVKLSL